MLPHCKSVPAWDQNEELWKLFERYMLCSLETPENIELIIYDSDEELGYIHYFIFISMQKSGTTIS